MEEEKKRKIVVGGIIGLIAIIMLIVLGVAVYKVIIDNGRMNDIASNEIYENSAVFENRPIINAAIGPDATAMILDNVSNFIFTEAEMKTAKYENTASYEMKNYYNVKINNDLMAYDSNFIYKVSIDVSDGRRYELSFRTDEKYGYEDFVMTAIKNLDTGEGVIYININNDNWQQLADWMREFSGLNKNVEVIIENNWLIDKNNADY